jgi:large subunit ribosomal protein L10
LELLEAGVLRAEKVKVVEDLNAVFSATGVVVLTHYKGLTVPEMTVLRRQMRDAGAQLRVTKNRLVRIALRGTPHEGMADLFTGPTAIAFSADPVAAPKVVVEYARRNERLAIVGGSIGTQVLDPAAVRALAELPPLDDLRAKLIALINTPAARLVGLLQAPGAQLARVLAAHSEAAGGAGNASPEASPPPE